MQVSGQVHRDGVGISWGIFSLVILLDYGVIVIILLTIIIVLQYFPHFGKLLNDK